MSLPFRRMRRKTRVAMHAHFIQRALKIPEKYGGTISDTRDGNTGCRTTFATARLPLIFRSRLNARTRKNFRKDKFTRSSKFICKLH